MDHAAIFTIILRRNALRREALLPPLDVRAEFQQAVATAHWQEVHDRHYGAIREEIMRRLRQERGPEWGNSAGGRWMVEALTAHELQRRFPLPTRYRPGSEQKACR